MIKLDLKEYMAAAKLSPPKLAKRIGEVCGDAPSSVSVWGWMHKGRMTRNKKWLNALATIFGAEYGEQFFIE